MASRRLKIDWIKSKIKSNQYELSEHAEEERQSDKISLSDLEQAILSGEIIENYPCDPRGASCLLLGFGTSGYPIHIICGKTNLNYLRIITVYIPSLPKWENPKTRRKV
ncbi:MAG: DUF4258 domain-containing protein [Candidatus Margulisbacteria bacterium]|nr:DUF4258 domain-containing protein [Candidatus Margulisiibacteriota bacterium]